MRVHRKIFGLVSLLISACPGCFDPTARTPDDRGPEDTAPANAAPVGLQIAVTPSSPTDDDTLTCTIITDAMDPDGDAITYAFFWSVDGTDAGLAGATVAASLTSGAQTWTCSVTPTDGTSAGTPSTASVTIAVDDADGDGYTTAQGDCGDTDPTVNPGETEDCATEADDNCDGTDNNQDAANCTVFYADNDGDGYGDPVAGRCRCYAAAGEVDDNTDSDDTDSDIHVALPSDYTTAWGSNMIAIPRGTFVMGSGKGDPDGSYTDHEVTLTRSFWLGRTEITRAQWEARPASAGWSYSTFACTGAAAECPADEINWYDVAQYANDLSTAEGLANCYTADGTDLAAAFVADPYACPGYRMPTEAEWEYAARAGEDTAYAGSDVSGDVGWTQENAFSMGSNLHEVATLAPNAWGLYDMSGNEWEWVSDWAGASYGGYGDGVAAADPAGPSSGSYRGIRGGAWYFDATAARVAGYRFQQAPDYRNDSIGARICRSVAP